MDAPYTYASKKSMSTVDQAFTSGAQDGKNKAFPIQMYGSSSSNSPNPSGYNLGTPSPPLTAISSRPMPNNASLMGRSPLAMPQYTLQSPQLQQQQMNRSEQTLLMRLPLHGQDAQSNHLQQQLHFQRQQQNQPEHQQAQHEQPHTQRQQHDPRLLSQQNYKHFDKGHGTSLQNIEYHELNSHQFREIGSSNVRHQSMTHQMFRDQRNQQSEAFTEDMLVQDPQLRHLHHLQSQHQHQQLDQHQHQQHLPNPQQKHQETPQQNHHQTNQHHQHQQHEQDYIQQHQQHQRNIQHQQQQQHQQHQQHRQNLHQHHHHADQRSHNVQLQQQNQRLQNGPVHDPRLQDQTHGAQTITESRLHPSLMPAHAKLGHTPQSPARSMRVHHQLHPSGMPIELDTDTKLGSQNLTIISKMVAATDADGTKKKRGRPKKLILDPTTNEYIDSSHENFKKLNKLLKQSSDVSSKHAQPMDNGIKLSSLNDEEMKQLLELKDRRGRPRKFPVEQTGITIKGVRVSGSMKGKRKEMVVSVDDSDKVQKRKRGRPKRETAAIG